ncbi:hypothetical protein K439DRAFT_1638738 [Ramaria rubella]|nr:hypothetical protein K439DRAFT_1638738 [Ramaria rubella]
MATERPRRSTTAKVMAKVREHTVEASTSSTIISTSKKRKAQKIKESHDVPTSLDFLLTNPKSPLVTLDLSTLINENTWGALSQESRDLLSTMLPPNPSPFFQPSLNREHPANRQLAEIGTELKTDSFDIDIDAMAFTSEPQPCFFADPFFEAGAKTFQDHLYSGWLTPAHRALVREYTEKAQMGELHAPWKDQVWAEEHPVVGGTPLDIEVAGEASLITLAGLAKHSVIRLGDVLSYRRHFAQLNRTVTKDVLIESFQTGKYSLTGLVAPSTQTYLPPSLLEHPESVKKSSEDAPERVLRLLAILNPSQLENALLDTDATVPKAKRPNANAWKSIGVWRWREDQIPDPSAYAVDSEEAKKGYREYHGTLFYLRGCFHDDL